MLLLKYKYSVHEQECELKFPRRGTGRGGREGDRERGNRERERERKGGRRGKGHELKILQSRKIGFQDYEVKMLQTRAKDLEIFLPP